MTLSEAEKQIGAILMRLEIDNNGWVDSISIDDTDVTRFSDATKQVLRSVRIDMKVRGARWS